MNPTIILIILSLTLWLSSCGPTHYSSAAYIPQSSTPSKAEQNYTLQQNMIKQLLEQAKTTPSPQKEYYMLQAAYLLAEQQNTSQAQVIASQVRSEYLTPETHYLAELVNIDILRQQGQITLAAQRLAALSTPPTLSPTTQIITHELRAKLAAQQGDILDSIRERILLDNLLNDPNAQAQNREQIWSLVQSLGLNKQTSAQQHSGSTMDGWLALGAIMSEYANSNKLDKELQQWQAAYPNHPGLSVINSNSKTKSKEKYQSKTLDETSSFQQIALLLPISGKLAPNAASIRDGFITAYNHAHTTAIDIKVYDTNDDKNVQQSYLEAVEAGADLVIGPLTKPGVVQLNALNRLPVSVLTLNYLQASNDHINQMYEFGLAPEDEARQAAKFAAGQGKRSALVLVQADEWGQRVSQAFIDEWYRMGGSIGSKIVFTTKDNMANVVRQALRLQLTKEQKERLVSQPQRRRDVDMIFLAASPVAARQIKPLLDFYYANDLTVYGTSSLYALPANTTLDRDLNGVYFCDMPWILSPRTTQPQLHATIDELWPDMTQTYARFFAMGIDAYHLGTQLPHLQNLHGSPLKGVTGQLYLANDGRIERQVECTSFQNGKPQLH